MAKRPNMTDDELDSEIQQFRENEGRLPSINEVLALCPCGRVRVQQRLAHWREQEITSAIQVADIPEGVRNELMLALDRALSAVILRERKLARESYASKWLGVQSDIEDSTHAYAELEKECQLLRNENNNLAAQLKTVNETLIMKAGEAQTLKSQLEAAQEECAKARAELAIATTRADSLTAENKDFAARNAEYQRNSILTSRELDRSNDARMAAEERERKASQNAERAVAECAIAQEQVRALQAEKGILQSRLEGLESLRTDYALAKDEINRLRSLLYAKKKNDQGQQQQQQKQRPPRNQRPEIRQQEGQTAPEQERQDQGNAADIPVGQGEQQETRTKTAEQPTPGQEEAETSDPAKVNADVIVRKNPHHSEE